MNKTNLSPYYRNIKRIPRNLKKKVKKVCGCHWNNNSNEVRLWYYLSVINSKYHKDLIRQIIV